MVCERCRHSNPDTFRFCGKCGRSLGREPAKSAVTANPSPVVSPSSILRLEDDSRGNTGYLLVDDEPAPRTRGPILLSLVFIAFLSGMGYFYWQNLYAPATRMQVPAPHPVPPPAFAYVPTPPLALANAQLAVTMSRPDLPDRKSADQIRFQRIAADLKEEAAAADPRNNPHLVEGEKYLYGRGVTQSCKEAIKNFKAAAKQDNAPALTHLGVMSASGHCMKKNRVEAYKWFAQAKQADPNNVWLDRSMDMLWANMSHRERRAILK